VPPGRLPSGRPPADRTSPLAIVAFVVSFLPFALVSAVLAVVALVRVRRTGERGRGLAIAALAISCVWAVVFVVGAVFAVVAVNSSKDVASLEREAVAKIKKSYPSASTGTARCEDELSWQSGSTSSCTVEIGADSMPVSVRRTSTAGAYSLTLGARVVDVRQVEREYQAQVSKAATTDVELACPEEDTLVRKAGQSFNCDATAEFGASTTLTMTMLPDGKFDWRLASRATLLNGGWVDSTDAKPGDCMLNNEARLGDGQIYAVNCARPHDAEVIYVGSLPAGRWPGDEAVKDAASLICKAAFNRYTGEVWEQSDLNFGYLWPAQTRWEGGDRGMLCYLYDPARESGRQLTGSAGKGGTSGSV
jgi:hypothetical protein